MYETQVEGKDFYIPERMMGSIERYVENGIIPGRFLKAIIENNLSDAVGQADIENLQNIPAYVSYFFNEVPSACWGSKKKMDKWVEDKRKEQK